VIKSLVFFPYFIYRTLEASSWLAGSPSLRDGLALPRDAVGSGHLARSASLRTLTGFAPKLCRSGRVGVGVMVATYDSMDVGDNII
jgi:hypothetical protein